MQGPMIHSQLLIFDRIIINCLNTFGRKVILVYDNVFQQKNMKSARLWVITMVIFIIQMLIQILQSGGHSKQNSRYSYLTFVTRVTM